jgi:hypothetical protein
MSASSSGGAVAEHSSAFTSSGTAGSFTVTVSSGGVSADASVFVVDPASLHLKINCGPNMPAVEGWDTDDGYVTGGADYTFGSAVDVSGVANAAPAELYRTVRHQDHSYSFPQVPNGEYVVRIHFNDESTNGRAMDYTIEGVKVLDGFSITAEAGGTSKALVKEFGVTVSDGNGLQIVAAKDAGNDAFEAGIEIVGLGVNVAASRAAGVMSRGPALTARPSGTGDIVFGWRASCGSPVSLEIYSSSGRLVHRINVGAVAEGPGGVAWDGRDESGNRLAEGGYIGVVHAGEVSARVTFVIANAR